MVFVVLGEGLADGINYSTGAAKKCSINFSKRNKIFFLSLHYNGGESYLFLKKTDFCKFKVNNNISWYDFCLGCISKDLTKNEQSETSLNGTVYGFYQLTIVQLEKKTFLIFTNI